LRLSLRGGGVMAPCGCGGVMSVPIDRQEDIVEQVIEQLEVRRGPHQMYAEFAPGSGAPIVLMHGFPDSVHLYDRLLPHLLGQRPVVRFDFLGWGRSDKPAGYPYTATNQVGDINAVVDVLDERTGRDQLVLVAHDASGPPAIDWALANPDRVSALVLLNTYYHWTPVLRRPPAIALYSTPGLGSIARRLAVRRPDINRRVYEWQVGHFIEDPLLRAEIVPLLYRDFEDSIPAFFRLNQDLIPTIVSRRRRLQQLRRFGRPVRIMFGMRDRYLNPRVALEFAELFPQSQLQLVDNAGHYVQVDRPERVAGTLLA